MGIELDSKFVNGFPLAGKSGSWRNKRISPKVMENVGRK